MDAMIPSCFAPGNFAGHRREDFAKQGQNRGKTRFFRAVESVASKSSRRDTAAER